MELMIAERIKQYRKERNMTQDALAQALSVSPQSVSKWECGDGYPDITLLPAIANYFEVTVDELIGNDEISAKEDVQKNYFNVVNKLSHDEQLELALKYHKKYPRNWHIATSLMREITRHHRDKLEEYKPLLNEIAERILKECTDSVSRRNAVKSMCMVCDEDEVGNWMKRDTRFYHEERLDIWEERYKLMGDDEQYWIYRYAGNFLRVAHTLDRLNKHPDYRGKPELCIEWHGMNLRMLDCVVNRADGDEIPDGWIGEYAFVYIGWQQDTLDLASAKKGTLIWKKCLR
ncbi:MAG: helix-turn-helix transcriptional regulator [Clostridia bacterium]|nr:helix-turn-helix transcriptional regulator [Clostridia bacterium]